jgi:hypothetical protein
MPNSQRSLTRWSLIILGGLVLLAILYYLTNGFGARVPI